jgi:hypothetical protein
VAVVEDGGGSGLRPTARPLLLFMSHKPLPV